MSVKHAPGQDKSKDPFDQPFLVDMTDSLIKEYSERYRQPMELLVCPAGGGDELAKDKDKKFNRTSLTIRYGSCPA